MLNRILIPTDGSQAALAAAEFGIELATFHDAAVHVLHAVEPIPLGRMPAGMEPAATEFEDVLDEQEAAGEAAIDEIAEMARDREAEIDRSVVVGSPATEIVDYAEGNDIDLIVMGTRGQSRSERFLLGSTAEKVTRLSRVPVLTYRSNDAEAGDL